MGTAPKPPKGEPPPPPACKVGDVVLDRYRVVEQIASGGHSVVFRGTDERLSRPVCIKVFSGLGGKSGVGRTSYEHFVQEAFALSRLTHPNTLRIYDFGHLGGKDEDGMPLQVCEFMNGGTLSQIVREQGRQALPETSRVIGAMCAALSEAHALGIVHRDIKPQNILFGSVGNTKLPKLADFGIAKWSAESEGSGPKRAEDTQIVAGQKLAMYSPSWAAPEQLAGQPVSAATDVYSLAVVAVYMLTGKAIFAEEDVYAGYKKRRHADDLVRDALAPAKLPKQVVALLVKALAFDPKKRLARIEELAQGLGATLEPAHPIEIPVTPTTPQQAITPPAGSRTVPPGKPVSHTALTDPLIPASAFGAQPTTPETPAPANPAPTAPPAPPPHVWHEPQVVVSPWMTSATAAGGLARRLVLQEAPQPVSDRQVHFVMATDPHVDLATDAGKIRVTFIATPSGTRILHIKGLSCFIAHLGGRPSPAVTLEQPGDLALVTPRAQDRGHVRVANGVPEGNQSVFSIGSERVAIAAEDCSDPILFDFGPGLDAYFVYTRGRAVPKPPRRR